MVTLTKEILSVYEKTHSLCKILNDDVDDDDKSAINLLRSSKYISDIDELSPILAGRNSFSIFSSNIQSMNTSFSEIKLFVQALQNIKFNFSVLCFQECYVSNDYSFNYDIPGYTTFLTTATCSRNGGLLTYVHEAFDAQFLVDSVPVNPDLWESHFVCIKSETLTNSVIVGNVYRPPRDDQNLFRQAFSDRIQKLKTNGKEMIITGDFNHNLLEIDSEPIIESFYELMTSFGMYPKITLPTRFSDNEATLIDNSFCKFSPKTFESFSGVLIKKFSDHQPHFVCFDELLKPVSNPVSKSKYITIRTKLDTVAMNDELCKIDFENLISSENLHTNTANFLNKISSIKESLTPERKVKFKKYKHGRDPWITTDILKSIEKRDKMYEKSLRMKAGPAKAALRTNHATFAKIIRRSLRKAEQEYYLNLFEQNINDSRKTWSTINSFINKKSKSNVPDSLVIDGIEIKDTGIIASKFNEFFSNIGHDFANALNYHEGGFLPFLHSLPQNENDFAFQPVSPEDVSKTIESLKPKDSCGIDNLSSNLLKSLKNVLSNPICTLINQSLNLGIFPNCLKLAKVIPVYKKDDKKNVSNYRPISLLPSLSKIFEKIVFQQIYTFLGDNNILFPSQYGFRAKHSTEHAALEIVNRIQKFMYNKDNPTAIFLDLSKAFDTLNHHILLTKLKHYGIRGNAICLMESYLKNRSQFVQINNSKSPFLPLTIGVPQGSILGPLLFIIYMNDIPVASKLFEFILYADDTSLLSTPTLIKSKNEKEINLEVAKITDWLSENRLSLNASKTKCMTFHYPQRKNVFRPKIQMNDSEIEQVQSFKFLGIVIDENLNWKSHLNAIRGKVLGALGILARLKNMLPPHTKMKIYHSLISCHLNYGLLLWGHRSDDIVTLQKRAMRLIMNRKYNSHTEPLFKLLNIMKLPDLYTLTILKFYYKHRYNMLPEYLASLHLARNIDDHDYPGTRNSQNIHQVYGHKLALEKIIPEYVNNLPINFQTIKDKLLHSNYQYGLAHICNAFKNSTISMYSSREICDKRKCFACKRTE